MKWVIELEGGPAFPANAVAACRIAAKDRPSLAEVFTRLGAAVAAAKTDDEPPPEDED